MKIILHICVRTESGEINLEIFYSRHKKIANTEKYSGLIHFTFQKCANDEIMEESNRVTGFQALEVCEARASPLHGIPEDYLRTVFAS